MSYSDVKVSYKIWLSSSGRVFGEGPYRLLRGIAEKGSLRQAAMEIGISYRKAWGILKECEKQLGFALIERKAGGPSGGYSKITPSGRELMEHYGRFREEIKKTIESAFHKNLEAFFQSQTTQHTRT